MFSTNQELFGLCVFSCAWDRLHVFSRSAEVAYFPALGSSWISSWKGTVVCSRAWQRCMFSRPWQRLSVSRAWQWLHVFTRFAAVACFPALGSSSLFPALGTRCTVFASSSDWFIAISLVLVSWQSNCSYWCHAEEGNFQEPGIVLLEPNNVYNKRRNKIWRSYYWLTALL